MSKIVFFIFLLFMVSSSAIGQDFPSNPNGQSGNQDNTEEYDSTTIVSNTFFDIFYGNPGRAAFYGLIIPSGGQIYNRKWWKVPIVLGIEGFTLYNIINTTTLYNGYQTGYKDILINGESGVGFNGIKDLAVLKSRRDSYRKAREYSWVFFIGTHVVALFEAFIDRHLMEFDISDDLTFNPIIPTQLGPVSGVTLTIPLSQKKEYAFKTLIE